MTVEGIYKHLAYLLFWLILLQMLKIIIINYTKNYLNLPSESESHISYLKEHFKQVQ